MTIKSAKYTTQFKTEVVTTIGVNANYRYAVSPIRYSINRFKPFMKIIKVAMVIAVLRKNYGKQAFPYR